MSGPPVVQSLKLPLSSAGTHENLCTACHWAYRQAGGPSISLLFCIAEFAGSARPTYSLLPQPLISLAPCIRKRQGDIYQNFGWCFIRRGPHWSASPSSSSPFFPLAKAGGVYLAHVPPSSSGRTTTAASLSPRAGQYSRFPTPTGSHGLESLSRTFKIRSLAHLLPRSALPRPQIPGASASLARDAAAAVFLSLSIGRGLACPPPLATLPSAGRGRTARCGP